MKKYLVILGLMLLGNLTLLGQEEVSPDDRMGKLQQRMKEYIQKRLALSREESEKFSPIFLRYIVELRRTHREFNLDKPMQQLKIAELRVRFRNEFREVLDEQRANKVYEYQREFENKIREEIKERRMEKLPRGGRKIQALLR